MLDDCGLELIVFGSWEKLKHIPLIKGSQVSAGDTKCPLGFVEVFQMTTLSTSSGLTTNAYNWRGNYVFSFRDIRSAGSEIWAGARKQEVRTVDFPPLD